MLFCAANSTILPCNVKFTALPPLTVNTNFGIMPMLSSWGCYALKQKAR